MQARSAPERPREVLIVHADADSRREIRRCLSQRSMACREAGTAREAMLSAVASPPDLIVVDLVLPDQSGLGLCRSIRESEQLAGVPIIAVTSQTSEIDRVLAFEIGVDDFLPAPFYPPELGARAFAVLRGFAERSLGIAVGERGPLHVDRSSGRAFLRGEPLALTSREFAVLQVLVGGAGRVITRRELIEQRWNAHNTSSERAVDAHIKSIRRKLGAARTCIETVRGVGYRYAEGF